MRKLRYAMRRTKHNTDGGWRKRERERRTGAVGCTRDSEAVFYSFFDISFFYLFYLRFFSSLSLSTGPFILFPFSISRRYRLPFRVPDSNDAENTHLPFLVILLPPPNSTVSQWCGRPNFFFFPCHSVFFPPCFVSTFYLLYFLLLFF